MCQNNQKLRKCIVTGEAASCFRTILKGDIRVGSGEKNLYRRPRVYLVQVQGHNIDKFTKKHGVIHKEFVP